MFAEKPDRESRNQLAAFEDLLVAEHKVTVRIVLHSVLVMAAKPAEDFEIGFGSIAI